jgi:hypothetical protein
MTAAPQIAVIEAPKSGLCCIAAGQLHGGSTGTRIHSWYSSVPIGRLRSSRSTLDLAQAHQQGLVHEADARRHRLALHAVDRQWQVLTGTYPDGLGNMHSVPDRALFDPVPWQSMAVWMLTQMKRWGYIKGDVNYAQIAEKVFLLTETKKQLVNAGWRAPDGANRKTRIMGKDFDPAKPEEYIASFAIRRAA